MRRRGVMGDGRVRVVSTRPPVFTFLACALCGVLLWDTDDHYRFTHPAGAS